MQSIDWRFTPFDMYGKLMGKVISLDSTSDALFDEGDVSEIIKFGTSGNQFDGHVAVVMHLRDGRLAAFETSYASYNGNNFTDGNGEIFVASDRAKLIARLSTYGRRLLET